ncbi:hypothetical protein HMN09_01152500 [Mycena chlorophos]|uniref:F-box domain-containing protein n=1 Tax=Mycena chlorophos TaxID=658473 RepID=A0A8H6VW90_MYCCL|nr:hypothetical protein HMN09_01152500 [Mycena chlorophos]
MDGGLWTELLETLSLAPSLTTLKIFAPWAIMGQPSDALREPYRLSERLRVPSLTSISYQMFLVGVPAGRSGIGRREKDVLEIEGENLRRLMSACSATLRDILIPGEHLFSALDPGVNWSNLHRLCLRGLWPLEFCASAEQRLSSPGQDLAPSPPESNAQSRLLHLLELMPNLRSLLLQMSVLRRDPESATFVISPSGPRPRPRRPDQFLRHLLEFELCSAESGERILEFLPQGLESLGFRRYPLDDLAYTLRQPILLCVQLEEMLNRADFPKLKTLAVWYRIQNIDDLDAEERLLEALPQRFPRMENLVVHRLFNHDSPTLRDFWDPVPRFRRLLSRFQRLQMFSFNLDDPQRAKKRPFVHAREEYKRYMVRLAEFALAIISDCPSLRHVGMYREIGDVAEYYWHKWEVGRWSDGRVSLMYDYIA